MVEHIKKIEPDHLHVQRRDEAHDDEEGRKRQGEEEEQEGEKDRFGAKVHYGKVLTDEARTMRHQTSLWNQVPAPPPRVATAPPESETGGATEPEVTGETDEFTFSTTTITFLRAAGLIDRHGRPRWPYVTLYGLALIGFVATTFFLLRILL